MRLTAHEVDAIKTAAREAFGDSAVVRLFGSRVDDALEGGDVDLHVEVDDLNDASERLWRMKSSLWDHLAYEKIDLLMSKRGGVPRGFERIAYRDGHVL